MENKVVAVIGVSTNPEKYGNRIFSDMVRAGWRVYGINPKGGEVAGISLFKSLDELPVTPDVVVFVVPPKITQAELPNVARKGISAVWMQPGSESDDAIRLAKRLGLDVTHSACIMVRSGLWKQPL